MPQNILDTSDDTYLKRKYYHFGVILFRQRVRIKVASCYCSLFIVNCLTWNEVDKTGAQIVKRPKIGLIKPDSHLSVQLYIAKILYVKLNTLEKYWNTTQWTINRTWIQTAPTVQYT
jgi:hypothetical protein